MRRVRQRLFPKYALLIIALVGSILVASGAIGIYFSWRETEAHLVELQSEKARNAAARIEQYIVDIAHQGSWTRARATAEGNALEDRKSSSEALRQSTRSRRSADRSERTGQPCAYAPGDDEGPRHRPSAKRSSGARPERVQYGPVYFRKGTSPI